MQTLRKAVIMPLIAALNLAPTTPAGAAGGHHAKFEHDTADMAKAGASFNAKA